MHVKYAAQENRSELRFGEGKGGEGGQRITVRQEIGNKDVLTYLLVREVMGALIGLRVRDVW